jgi:transketolase
MNPSVEAVKMPSPALDERSKYLRRLVVRAMIAAKRGHLGPSLSIIDVIRVLYDDILEIDPKDPLNPRRDRFILSKGHGCLALYALLSDKGFFDPALLETFCRFDSPLGGHPEIGTVPGIEASTGSLGHGLSIGLGIALALRMKKIPSRVFVAMGDGETNEGSVWEAALSAGKHRLSNLVALVDYNKYQSYSSTREVQDMEPFAAKWRSFNFATEEVDGHDIKALREVFTRLPFDPHRPSAIICHTVKGKGIPMAENNPEWHHKNKLKDDEIAAISAALGGL